jgi:hypothetical protein
MSEIYAAAQLTIVAAAGKDPSHGLPGVRSGSRKPCFRCETIDIVHLHLAACPPPGTTDIANSVWHSRAWTFQEGYYSKKKLFFTDRQMVYICQSPHAHHESKYDRTSGRGPLEYSLPVPRAEFPFKSQWSSPLTRAMYQIQAYSQRKLSHDADALKAIRSALESQSLENHNVHHIWGIPLEYNSQSPTSSVIALNWCHYQPGRRRNGFPSWSMLGWEDSIQWCDHAFSFHEEDFALLDSTTVTVHGVISMTEYRQRYFGTMVEPPKSAVLTAYAAPVSVVKIVPPTKDSETYQSTVEITYLAVAYTKNVDLLLRTHWDREPSGIKPLICITLKERTYGCRNFKVGDGTKLLTVGTLLVLEANKHSYERVGICSRNSSWKRGDIFFRQRTSTPNAEWGPHRIDDIWPVLHGLENAWQMMSDKRTIVIV